jgi:hypothetical protein
MEPRIHANAREFLKTTPFEYPFWNDFQCIDPRKENEEGRKAGKSTAIQGLMGLLVVTFRMSAHDSPRMIEYQSIPAFLLSCFPHSRI